MTWRITMSGGSVVHTDTNKARIIQYFCKVCVPNNPYASVEYVRRFVDRFQHFSTSDHGVLYRLELVPRPTPWGSKR